MTDSQWSTLRFFKPDEFRRPESMSYSFLVRLDSARADAGVPFRLTSTWRDWPEGTSHAKGVAVDIQCHHGYIRLRIVKSLLKAGFDRIILYPRHVHVDGDQEKPSILNLGEYDAQEQNGSA